MKIAITGGSGHIGNCLIRELIKRGATIKALVHNFDNSLKNLDLELVKGDLTDKNSLDKLCTDTDVVFHLAARIAIDKNNKDVVYNTNVGGTQNIIDICIKRKIKRFIHFSSIHTLDPHPLDEVLDENRAFIGNTKLIYEQSKADSEKLVIKAAQKGLNAVVLNPTAVIGPNDFKGSYLGQALIKIYQNKLPVLVPGGYDWVDVRDIVNASIEAITKGNSSEKFILSGHYLSLKELSALIGKISKHKTPGLLAPLFLAKIGLPFIRLYSIIMKEHPLYTSESLDILKNSNKLISNSKATQVLDFKSRPLEETLRDTFTWYKQNGTIN
ncbi:MAG: NAD-dependent epimerase/dehydratase family protein [Bacteroidales bacterium]|nr:NAD-dependent epimerase/dehydratase family protein [Bacteroidales bacterium]